MLDVFSYTDNDQLMNFDNAEIQYCLETKCSPHGEIKMTIHDLFDSFRLIQEHTVRYCTGIDDVDDSPPPGAIIRKT